MQSRGTGVRLDRRRDVLDALRSEPRTVGQVADELGVHVNTVRFHLQSLTRSGQVERVDATHGRTGRPAGLFSAVARMDPAGPRHFEVLAEALVSALADQPDADREALDVGRRWGRSHRADGVGSGQADDLFVALDDLGFAPQWQRAGQGGHSGLGLRNCPFLSLASERPRVVCAIHLGMMQGMLDGHQSGLTVEALEPFVEPDLCLVRLSSDKEQ